MQEKLLRCDFKERIYHTLTPNVLKMKYCSDLSIEYSICSAW